MYKQIVNDNKKLCCKILYINKRLKVSLNLLTVHYNPLLNVCVLLINAKQGGLKPGHSSL